MYYNQKHKEKIKERKDNYIYIGSYHYREITLDNKNTKNGAIIRVKCPYCSKEYDVRLDSFINKNKSKCIYCCNKYENSFAYYIQVELGRGLNEFWDWEKNTVNPYLIYKSSNKYKIWIKCNKTNYHGSYELTPSNFYGGNRCPCCNSKKVHPKDSFAQWGIDTFGNDFLEKYWSDKNTLNPFEIALQSMKVIYILCQNKEYHNDKGGYKTTPMQFYKGNRCSYCYNRKIHPKDSFGYLYPEKAKYWSNRNDKSPYEVAPMSKQKYWFICEKCGKEFSRDLSILNQRDTGVICNNCNSSQGETKIIHYLNKHNIEYIHDKPYFNDLIGLGNYLLRPDFILPNERIWIEYDGIQHDKMQINWQTKEGFEKLQEHDKRKNKYAIKNNWKLIRIKEKDFNNIENILDEIFN